jgi:hypothetical protein
MGEGQKLNEKKKPTLSLQVRLVQLHSARKRLRNITLYLKPKYETSSEENLGHYYETGPKKSNRDICSLLQGRETDLNF